jgi:16S rRNA G966 N2-methylase RsmD
MPYYLDIELTEGQKAELARIPAGAWFTSVDFKNARSPRHPTSERQREARHEMKRQLMLPWIRSQVEGKRVLDLFCANGVFSVEAALAGAREMVGIDFSPDRAACARFFG